MARIGQKKKWTPFLTNTGKIKLMSLMQNTYPVESDLFLRNRTKPSLENNSHRLFYTSKQAQIRVSSRKSNTGIYFAIIFMGRHTITMGFTMGFENLLHRP